MASGYTSGVTNGSFTVRFHWTSSYNAATNQSTITVMPQVYNTGNYGGSLRACGGSLSNAGIYLNGSLDYAFDGTWGTSYNLVCSANVNSWTDFPPYSGSISTMTVTHNANGVATATVRFLGTVVPLNSTSYRKAIDTGSQTISITENAASSIASASSSAATQSSYSLTMSRKASTNYHIATFKYNNQTTLYTSGRFDTSLSFSVPRSWFAGYPSAVSLPITVSVQTYNSAGAAVGGAVTHALTVVADAGMRPAVSAGWAALAAYNTGAASGMTGYIKGFSRAEASFDPTKIDLTNAVGASIASYSVSCQGETVSASPYRTPLLASLSVTVVCTVTDTRGRTASESFALSVMDCAAPVLSGIELFRCLSDGTADEDGTYISLKAGVSFSSVGGQNSCTLCAAVAPSGGVYGAETALVSGEARLLGTFSPDASYSVRFTAADDLGGSAVYYATIPTRKWAMKFRPDGSGVAFGKAAEFDNTFEIADGWSVKGKGLIDLIYPVGSLYLTVSSVSPETLFGGTWELTAKDRFLVGAGLSCAVGASGGSARHLHSTGNHTLTVHEMPGHTHGLRGGSSSSTNDYYGGSAANYGLIPGGSPQQEVITYTGGNEAHNHGNTGEADHIPPYLAVYIWKRTA